MPRKKVDSVDGEFLEVNANTAPDPVVDIDEESIDDLLNDDLFLDGQEPDPVSVSGATSFAEALGNDRRFHNPDRQIQASIAAREPAAVGGDGHNPLGDLIQRQVSQMVKDHLASLGLDPASAHGTPFIDVANIGRAAPRPPVYEKHYRSDVYPDLKIQELDMSALDRDDRPSAYPIVGSYIAFRNSHLFLQKEDKNKIRQIEWMRQRPGLSANGEHTMGGNPSIYEDDGGDIFKCPQGCDYVTASKNAYRAHMRATHQVVI